MCTFFPSIMICNGVNQRKVQQKVLNRAKRLAKGPHSAVNSNKGAIWRKLPFWPVPAITDDTNYKKIDNFLISISH